MAPRIIPLTRGYSTVIDDADFEEVSKRKWFTRDGGGLVYAYRHNPRRLRPPAVIALHRQLIAALPGEIVDHINGDGLDNRRKNLRIATRSENMTNRHNFAPARGRSRFRGVFFRRDCRSQPWCSQIKRHGKTYNLGYHATEERAAEAYDAAVIAFGDPFACLNFPERYASSGSSHLDRETSPNGGGFYGEV